MNREQKLTLQRRHQLAVETGHFSPELFYGIRISAQEPWLYFIWYAFLASLAGFISGVGWTPLAIQVFGTFYSGISQSVVLNPAGELLRTGGQILTSVALYVTFIVGVYRKTLQGHKQHYLLPTIRFEGDEYTQIPFVIDHSNLQNMDKQIPVPGWHVSKAALSIPYSGYVKSLRIVHRIVNAVKPGSYSSFQPIDTGFIVHQGSQSETFRYHEGRVPYYGLLLECPDTLPCGLTVYFGKQYEKDGKPVPVMFAHDSPYSVELVKKMASIGGLKYEDIKSLDEAIDHHYSIDLGNRVEELELELFRVKMGRHSDDQRVDQEVQDTLHAHGMATSNEPAGERLNRRLSTRAGIIGISGFLLFIFLVALAFKEGWLH
jgi:hypothetical protein